MKNTKNNLNFSYKNPPLIIAEISGNHNGSKSRFLKLIKKACESGADLIKIQTYEPEDITLSKKNKFLRIKSGIWKGKYFFDLYKKACTPYKWHHSAFKIAKKYNKIIFSSPFSIKAVNYLEKFNVPIYKIASFEITDYNLISYIASKKKPIIISTGMATIKEIKSAIKIIEKYHKKIVILHCVSNYPTKIKETNLKKINILKQKFKKYHIGLSDHTNDIFSSIASIPLGVCAIEKHFNIDNKRTTDSLFSIGPKKMRDLKNISVELFESLHKEKNIKILNKNIKFRRSIYAKKNIRINEKITHKNIITLRPKIGICASEYYKIIGKKLKKNIKANDPIYNNYLE
jgi:pseudaminic acid synthase